MISDERVLVGRVIYQTSPSCPSVSISDAGSFFTPESSDNSSMSGKRSSLALKKITGQRKSSYLESGDGSEMLIKELKATSSRDYVMSYDNTSLCQ